ncbi:glycosyltransferase family 87 protein [Spirosoma daeguense]
MKLFFQHPFFYSKRNITIIWALLGILTGVKQYYLGELGQHINNFLLFINSYKHLVAHQNLFLEYHTETVDSYHYGPIFALLVAPFYWLPTLLSITLWNVFNSLFLLYAIYELPLSDRQKAVISWLVLNSSYTCLLNTQFHHICVGMIILSYTQLYKRQEVLAAANIVLGTLIKLYGVVGLAYFPFAQNKFRYFIGGFLSTVVFITLPMLFVGFDYTIQCYFDWYESLSYKNQLNVNLANTRTDVCVMGMFRRLFHDGTLSNLYFIIPGLIIFTTAYLKTNLYQNIRFQLNILASTLLFLNLASTGFESPTFIISFTGVAIWYVVSGKTRLDNWLLAFALLISSFAPTDIFPAYIRDHYVNPYALMVLPLLFVWLRLHWTIWKGLPDTQVIESKLAS